MSAGRTDAVAVSPTAHYTGETWVRHGLSDPGLSTRTGRLLHAALRPSMAVAGALGLPTLDDALVARHRVIDAALEAEIRAGRIGQVLEVAAGMSPRGLRLVRRYPELRYVEGDLEGMAQRKRAALVRIGTDPDRHRVTRLDARLDGGEGSLAQVAAGLDPRSGLAIVTEGLVNYLPRPSLEALWSRIARALRGFDSGLYASDLFLAAGPAPARLVAAIGSRAVGGRVTLHYATAALATRAITGRGFGDVRVLRCADDREAGDRAGTAGAKLVHVVLARP